MIITPATYHRHRLTPAFARRLVRLVCRGVFLTMTWWGATVAAGAGASYPTEETPTQNPQNPAAPPWRIEKIGPDLPHPWSMAWVDADHALVTTIGGDLLVLNTTSGAVQQVTGAPAVRRAGQGGLLDVITDVSPSALIKRNREDDTRLWMCYAKPLGANSATTIASAILRGGRLFDLREIFMASPPQSSRIHFGCRLALAPDGKLYASIGERGSRHQAQNPRSHLGTVIRIERDGTIPNDNPPLEMAEITTGTQGNNTPLAEIFTLGHRNPQGMAVNQKTGNVWIHEHGPRGGDELNVLRAGANYGWPIITHGAEYFGGKIGSGTSHPSYQSPLLHWTPSIAPSGMAFYYGDKFAAWSGSLLVGSLKFHQLRRLSITYDQSGQPAVSSQQIVFDGDIGRVRDVRVGPRGFIWLLSDEPNGGVWKMSPK